MINPKLVNSRKEFWDRCFTLNKLSAWSLFMAVALISLYAQILPFDQPGNRFIGHADQAEVAMVARNFAEGRGMTSDVVWLLHNGGQAGNEVSHPEGYWSIYVAAILASFFKVFGANQISVLLAASLIKIGVAAFGVYWIRRLTNDYFAAMVGGVILLIHPIMAGQVSALSDIYLTFCILGAFTSLIWAVENGKFQLFFLSGAFVGLAIGMKPTGLILLGIFPAWILLDRNSLLEWKKQGLVLAGVIFTITPLAMHNYNAGGSIWWPDAALIKSAGYATFLTGGSWKGWGSWQTVAAWNSSVYDPTSKFVNLTFGSLEQVKFYAANFNSFYQAALSGYIAPLWLLPFSFHVVANQFLTYWRNPIGYKGLLDQFTAATLLLCGAGLILAFAVHAEARYWNFLIPFLVVIGIVGASGFSRAILVFLLVWCALVGVKFHYNTPVQIRNVAEYRILDDLLPKEAIVMTSNPWEFSFHTRRRSVALPYTRDPKVVTDLAERYGVDYLVVINKDARHSSFNSLEQGTFPPYLKKVYYSNRIVVGEFEVQTESMLNEQIRSLFKFAFAQQKQGQRELAIITYEQLLRLDPVHRQAMFNLAYAYLKSAEPSDWDRSTLLFEKVLDIDPQYFEALHHLASAYWKVGNKVKGVRYDRLYLEKGQHVGLKSLSQTRLINTKKIQQ